MLSVLGPAIALVVSAAPISFETAYNISLLQESLAGLEAVFGCPATSEPEATCRGLVRGDACWSWHTDSKARHQRRLIVSTADDLVVGFAFDSGRNNSEVSPERDADSASGRPLDLGSAKCSEPQRDGVIVATVGSTAWVIGRPFDKLPLAAAMLGQSLEETATGVASSWCVQALRIRGRFKTYVLAQALDRERFVALTASKRELELLCETPRSDPRLDQVVRNTRLKRFYAPAEVPCVTQ